MKHCIKPTIVFLFIILFSQTSFLVSGQTNVSENLFERPIETVYKDIADSNMFVLADIFYPNGASSTPASVSPKLTQSEIDKLQKQSRELLQTLVKYYPKKLPDLTSYFKDHSFPQQLSLKLVVKDTGAAPVGGIQPDGEIDISTSVLQANFRASVIYGPAIFNSESPQSPNQSNQDAFEKRALDDFFQLRQKLTGIPDKNRSIYKALIGGDMNDVNKYVEGYFRLLEIDKGLYAAKREYQGAMLFVIAHEMGHKALGHLGSEPKDNDEFQKRELAADKFATILLTDMLMAFSVECIFAQNGPIGGYICLVNKDLLNRYVGYDTFLGRGFELARFERKAGNFTYPDLKDRLSASGEVLALQRKAHGLRVAESVENRLNRRLAFKPLFEDFSSILSILK